MQPAESKSSTAGALALDWVQALRALSFESEYMRTVSAKIAAMEPPYHMVEALKGLPGLLAGGGLGFTSRTLNPADFPSGEFDKIQSDIKRIIMAGFAVYFKGSAWVDRSIDVLFGEAQQEVTASVDRQTLNMVGEFMHKVQLAFRAQTHIGYNEEQRLPTPGQEIDKYNLNMVLDAAEVFKEHPALLLIVTMFKFAMLEHQLANAHQIIAMGHSGAVNPESAAIILKSIVWNASQFIEGGAFDTIAIWLAQKYLQDIGDGDVDVGVGRIKTHPPDPRKINGWIKDISAELFSAQPRNAETGALEHKAVCPAMPMILRKLIGEDSPLNLAAMYQRILGNKAWEESLSKIQEWAALGHNIDGTIPERMQKAGQNFATQFEDLLLKATP